MKYGHFDDNAKEYVIDTPQTPYPWINYLGNENFFGIISNTLGGYCFYRDARFRRLIRYRYNSIPVDSNGRYYYIKEGNDFWSPSWQPVKRPLDRYECRHGLGYTRVCASRGGIDAEILAFIPMGYNMEVHKVTLKNNSSSSKELKLFSFVEFCIWNALDDMTNFQRNYNLAEVEVDGSTIYHKTEYRERRNHYSFFSVNAPISGFDTQLEDFCGLYNGLDHPQAVASGASRNSVASGWQPIGSHCIDVKLAPGASKSFIFTLGYVENPPDRKYESPGIIDKSSAKEMLRAFQSEADVDDAMGRLAQYWDQLFSSFKLETSDEKLSRMVNIWNPYQCMTTFNMSRSASLFESGISRGLGFRDSSQDLLGFVHLVPERARERILSIAATQFRDGSAYHQFQPLTNKGNDAIGSGFNDDPIWLVACTSAYIKETGDDTILDEQVPFDCDPSDTGTLLEHLVASYRHVAENKGPHSLPLIGRADWNDCLNLNCFSQTPDESFQTFGDSDGRIAESVLIAGMFVAFMPDLASILKRKGDLDLASEVETEIGAMKKAVLESGYDGDWFLRAYDAFGNKIGSKSCEEGRIFIEPQGFCVMGGIGLDDGKAESALVSVGRYLETEHGIVMHQPAYKKYHLELGEISSYPPGYKENASIFCHNNPWIICAETILGHGDRAFDLYKKIAPSYREEISDIHRMEPYVYSQTIAGWDAPRFGEAKNSWLTGTAAWSFVAISQYILGIRPDFHGLRIDPCIPGGWQAYRIFRKFRNAGYWITVQNPDGVCKGIKAITVDNEPIVGNILPLFKGGVHEVIVVLGSVGDKSEAQSVRYADVV